MRSTQLPIDAATLRRLAVQASCDPRTIRRAASGKPVRGLAGHRAREALAAAGYELAPAQETAPVKVAA